MLMVMPALYAAAQDAPPESNAAKGRSLYTSYCARCHGVNMVNTGVSFDLRVFPKDQKDRFIRSVSEGIRAMPAWESTLKRHEIESLWMYVSAAGLNNTP